MKDTMENTWDKFQNELQKAPKKVGCLACGFRSEDVEEIEDFQENGCPECETFENEIKITFQTSRKLTTAEFLTLAGYLELQISEPWNEDQEDAEWSGRNIIISEGN